MTAQILIWWLTIQFLGMFGLPLTTMLFRTLPDRGYAFSKSLGLLLTSYGAWVVAMLGFTSFSRPLLVAVALCMGGVGLYLSRRQQASEEQNAGARSLLRRAGGYLRQHWPGILFYEAVFLLALVLLAWMRAHNPDPWGTERPMDFAFFNAIQRSATFPPHDPWLSGYSINYYYFGYLMMAAMSLLSGLQASVAFNLALALVFALTALNVAGVLNNLVLGMRGRGAENGGQRTARDLLARYGVMLLGVVLVLFASNQAGVLQLVTGDYRVVALDERQLLSAIGQGLRGKEDIELPYPVYTNPGEFGTFSSLVRRDNLIENYNWWWASRALWDEHPTESSEFPEGYVRIYNITEFPFFSFWLGDMHPHVMALPFCLLAMALALATLARPAPPAFAASNGEQTPHYRSQWWVDLILSGLVLGSLYAINSWDLPTYSLLYGGALFLLFMRHASDPEAFPWLRWLAYLGVLAFALYLLFLPFYLTFVSFAGEAEPLTVVPIVSKITEIVAPLNSSRSGLHAYLLIFGLFLFPLVGFAYLLRRPPQPTATRPDPLLRALPWLTPALLIVGIVVDFPLLALAGLAVFAFSRAIQRVRNPEGEQAAASAEAYILLVLALGCAICFGTDIMYIRDVFNSRMNTIFKFYYQVWLLWGTVTAGVVWWLIVRVRRGAPTPPPALSGQRATRMVAASMVALFVVLLAGSLVYPAINLRNMVRNDTVSGLEGKIPRQHTPAGENAIAWLRANAVPGSVILEMVAPLGGSYNPEGYGGVSAATGIPTVLGWVGHENQWRRGHEVARDEIQPRRDDVDRIYRTTESATARRLLNKYDVTYIYVGGLERQTYSPESLSKFDIIADPVFQEDEVTVYRVDS